MFYVLTPDVRKLILFYAFICWSTVPNSEMWFLLLSSDLIFLYNVILLMCVFDVDLLDNRIMLNVLSQNRHSKSICSLSCWDTWTFGSCTATVVSWKTKTCVTLFLWDFFIMSALGFVVCVQISCWVLLSIKLLIFWIAFASLMARSYAFIVCIVLKEFWNSNILL